MTTDIQTNINKKFLESVNKLNSPFNLNEICLPKKPFEPVSKIFLFTNLFYYTLIWST